jgi:dephospho-CoA kinase
VGNNRAALRLGLTGGIGSGKSTVATLFANRGAAVIDADAISRAVTSAGGSAIDALREAFGPGLLTADGALDRDQMRSLVFSDLTAKTRLEGIVHPLVSLAIAQQAHQANSAGANCIVFDIPLLVESRHWRSALDRVLVVDCTEATQVHRVAARSGLSDVAIRKIIAAQATRLVRLRAADAVVFNDGITIEELALHVHEISTQFEL